MKGAERDRKLLAEHFTKEGPLRIQVITLSDRASAGEYEDRSGPRIESKLQSFFEDSGIPYSAGRTVLSDDPEMLTVALQHACNGGVHVIFTTGGTGVGPRDNTPDVVMRMADKIIPGIMEAIRMKYSIDKPCALLSRTVAAIIGSTVVYTLPGSTKGVDEYMTEILQSLEHTICVLHEFDVH